eukprot:m.133896 g.133896  ORF g.133896 m.133896 type:complete len:238 (-) comp52433_c0_seq2:109-822(-)
MLLVVAVLIAVAAAYECSGQATGACSVTGYCPSSGLSELPCGISPDVIELDLDYDAFTAVTANMFQGGLENVQNLDMNTNAITVVELGAFNGLPNLVTIFLSNNYLTSLVPGLFNNSTQLRWLLLDGNQFLSVPTVAFFAASSVIYLDLSFNNITVLAASDFNGLINLENLYLTGNAITQVSSLAFDSLPPAVDLQCGPDTSSGYCAPTACQQQCGASTVCSCSVWSPTTKFTCLQD